MPTVTITQRFNVEDGDNGNTGTVNQYFLAEGSDDYADVVAALGDIPLVVDGLPRQRIRREHVGGGFWYLTAEYSAVDQSTAPVQPGEQPRTEFDTTGGDRVLRTHATLRGGYAGPGLSTAADYGDAINVVDGVPNGVEVETGGGVLTITQVITPAQASNTYVRKLMTYAKKVVNAATFKGFAAYEVRFMGARITTRGDGDLDLTRVFQVAQNVSSGSYAGVSGIDKRGHEYIWAAIERQADATALTVVPRVLGVYVHELYEPIDFGELDP